MNTIGPASYVPVLRFKRGEYEAHHLLDDPNKDRIIAHIVFPSQKERDKEKGRVLSRDELIATQTGRIARHWERRPLLVDARFLKFDDDPDEDGRWFRDLLAETALRRCSATPVVDLRTSVQRVAAVRDYAKAHRSRIAIRLGFSDLNVLKSGTRLQERLLSLSSARSETVLILDFGNLAKLPPETFAELFADLLSAAQHLGPWLRVVVEATNYPEQNPAPPNGTVEEPRTEWLAWRDLTERFPWVLKFATFGDYGADNSKINFDSGGRVQTHLRYTIPAAWMICRGGDAEETTDGTIHAVSQEIVDSPAYAGELFSAGDEEIARWAARLGGPGAATEWRRANMNHHMTRLTVDIGDLVGEPVERALRRRRPVQQELFAVSASSPAK